MKVKLHLAERFSLSESILPKEGNFISLKQVRKAREALAVSDEEHKKYDIKVNGNSISWDPVKAEEMAEIELSDFVVDMIKAKLKTLDKEGKLEESKGHFRLYEAFVEGGQNE